MFGEIKYELLKEEHISETSKSMSYIFINYEPMSKKIGYSYEEYLYLTEKYCKVAAEDGYSYVAVDNETKKVAGFIIAFDMLETAERLGELDEEIIKKGEKSTFLIEELEKPLFNQNDKKKGEYLHLYYTGVFPEYTGHGIAKELLKSALKNAAEKGFKWAYADSTNPISRSVLEKNGFEQINYIDYSKFEINGKLVFDGLEGGCSLMIKRINSQVN